MARADSSDASQPLPYLPLPVVLDILNRLLPNDIAGTARLLSKSFRDHFQSSVRILVNVPRSSPPCAPSSQRTSGITPGCNAACDSEPTSQPPDIALWRAWLPAPPRPPLSTRLLPPLSPIESYADVPTGIMLAVAARQAPAYAAAASRELLLAAALHGDTDLLSQLGALEQVQQGAAALAADLAYHAVREGLAAAAVPPAMAPADSQATAVAAPAAPAAPAGRQDFMRMEVLEWLAKTNALWRCSDAPFLAAALSLRQRALAADGDEDDAEGPGAAEELRRALGRLHTAGFGSFHAAGRTFLAAVDLAARGKAAAELVCWLLDCGCPTGPPGWSYMAAIRPVIGRAASATAAERCLGLAARLARRRVPLSSAALSGIAALPYDVYCSYITLLVRDHGCPVDRTALYGEIMATVRQAASGKGAGALPSVLQHKQQPGCGLPGWQLQQEQQRKLQWLAQQGLMPTRLERWAPGRLLARTKERLRGLVRAGSSDSRCPSRGASAAAASCEATDGGRSGAGATGANGGVGNGRPAGGVAGVGMGGGVAFTETAVVAAATGAAAGTTASGGGSRALGGAGSKARGKAGAPSTLHRLEEMLSGLPESLGVGGDAVRLAAAAGRVSATAGVEEVFDTRATSVLAWDLQVA
ncbi:hypothetical protein HXX76_000383 [Chlamydomonas incerta]|uniref:F-box domain-containing protein n=1 Tax=Chlamydomonas incerta TaxID=51695 RepID=A0A836B2Y6_CHLIN|nr:hypothetical protein HXX76_000383 [Chlamydomonas incerta]|eukprot:KAG2445779.1 hypothetical protein HXX76_000383 [Chlamydomonas incerta]